MKSFALSFLLTAFIFVYFISLFDAKANAYIRKLPDLFFIVMVVVLFVGYIVALYWGITGIVKGDRVFNFMGIGLSLIGLGLYWLAYVTNKGNGKEAEGQFEHDLSKIEAVQQAAVYELLKQTNTSVSDVQFVPYWGMNKNTNDFVLCVQQGNVIALQIKNKALADVQTIAKLKQLAWLVLQNCGLKSMEGLHLPQLQRLSVNHNLLTNLAGFENSPNVAWINFSNNLITDSSALKSHPAKSLYIETE